MINTCTNKVATHSEGRFFLCTNINVGSVNWNCDQDTITKLQLTSSTTLGGAEAVNAIKGAVVSALSPSSRLNAVLKLFPLFLMKLG